MIIAAAPSGCGIVPASVAREIRNSLASTHGFINPLAVPAEADIIDLVAIADPSTPWPKRIKLLRRPTVLMLGDDPGSPDGMGGPDAWRCLPQLKRWVRGVIVHGAGGQPEHYAEAVRAARRLGRVAMIESTSKHAVAWARSIGCPRTLLILPRGGLHPLPLAEAA
jgi:hypothetical protein